MLSSKHNSIMAITTGLISSLFNVASSEDMSFVNRSCSNACILILPKLTFVILLLHFFLPYHIGDNLWYARYGFSVRVSAEQIGALFASFYAWNVSQTFEDLEAAQSIMIPCVVVTHPLLYVSITWVCTLTIMHFIFSVMTGLIVEMLFMLFSIYNTA